MDQLLFAARKLVQNIHTGTEDPEGHLPDLAIPEDLAHIPTLERYMEICSTPFGGSAVVEGQQGFVAKQNLPAGTLLLVAKPIAIVLDSEDDHDDEAVPGTALGVPAVGEPSQQPRGAEAEAGGEQAFVESDEFMAEDESGHMDDGDHDDDDDHDNAHTTINHEEDKDPRVNELLLLEVLDQLNENPSLWTDSLSKLFPRTDAHVAQLPAWICHDDDIFLEFENGLKALEQKHEMLRPVVKDISKRLPLIIRYNILSMETCPELLSYPGTEGYASLAGVGLYFLPSFFNHSRHPNCARYAVGDVMFFVTNQDVAAGTQVCISYIEHDILCESAFRRNLMLSMDFADRDEAENHDNNNNNSAQQAAEREGPEMPVVDSDVQNELMTMDALERLKSIDELLAQATGQKGPEEGNEVGAALPLVAEEELMMSSSTTEFAAMETSATHLNTTTSTTTTVSAGWFQCDVQNLRILKAITLEGLGQSQHALTLWEEAIQFCETLLPPLDENGIVVRVQAALTSWYLGDAARAQNHALVALKTHHLLFGGGVALFRLRVGPDLRLPLRPQNHNRTNGIAEATDALWPLTASVS